MEQQQRSYMSNDSTPLLFVCSQEGVEVRVARIFNTFGSRMHMNDGRVVSNFILQALQGEPLTVRILSFLLIMCFHHLSGERDKPLLGSVHTSVSERW